jgi:putative phosphoesterase
VKILIISDSHGHIANIKAVMEIAKKSDIKAVIHCGDWDNIQSVEAVLSFGLPLYTILGNADVEEGLKDYLRSNATKFDPYFLKFKLDGRRIGVKHRIKKDNVFEKLDIVFSGHYHFSESKMINFLKFVRPGAIINGINFAVYTTETNDVQFVSEA